MYPCIRLAEAEDISFSTVRTEQMVSDYMGKIDQDMQENMAEGQFEALETAAKRFKEKLTDASKDGSKRAENRLLGHNKHLINLESTHPIQVSPDFQLNLENI